MSEDYSDLFDKEFEVIGNLGAKHPGKLVDIDFDIGLTIIEKGSKDHYLLCIIGPTTSSSNRENGNEIHTKLFDAAVKGIRSGTLHLGKLNAILGTYKLHGSKDKPSSTNCAFNR